MLVQDDHIGMFYVWLPYKFHSIRNGCDTSGCPGERERAMDWKASLLWWW